MSVQRILSMEYRSRFLTKGLFYLCVLLLSGCNAVVSHGTDFGTMIVHLSKTFPSIVKLITAVAYIMGLVFVTRGIMALKVFGQPMIMTSSQRSLSVPLTYLLVGVALLFSPTMIKITSMSFFGLSNPIGYLLPGQSLGLNAQVSQAVLQLVQIFGLIAFMRGWVMLAGLGKSAQATAGKAITHIVGGVCSMNIGSVIQILQNSLT